MLQILDNFYAQWRLRGGVVPLLREDAESPPEYLLQGVWQHQRLLRDGLKTLDGQPVRVLHPGFRSVEGGPDFRGAVVQVGDEPPRTGDVEVDLRSAGWRAHGHDRNPAFKGVILHVIWEGERGTDGAPPTMQLCHSLDAPLGELNLWLGSEPARGLPENLRGKCCEPLRSLPSAKVAELLQQAAHVRLQSKAALFQARARQAGWEQALWEGLFRALGYKHNVWPMQQLAELRPRWAGPRADKSAVQARLLGLSGLLPMELPRARGEAGKYVRGIWDQWWRERDEFADCVLPRELWRLHGLRPANHPERRLALAAHWAVHDGLMASLDRWCGVDASITVQARSLLELFQARDDYWSWHFTFRSARLKRPQPLLGATRVTDLAINVILPWLWMRAVEGKNAGMQKIIEQRYFSWPAAQDNSVLRLARERLLGGAGRRALPLAAIQQGLIQIVRDFCEHSNALCENCKMPGLVREEGVWASNTVSKTG